MKKNYYFYSNLLAWGLVLLLAANYVFGWITPSGNPPTSNLPAPINISSTNQSKEGYLAVGTSAAPSYPLDVAGTIQTIGLKISTGAGVDKVLTSDASGIASWKAAGGVPSGVIAMWSGTLATIPSGWHLCDGADGTPDLRNRFVYGTAASENPGATGGATTHSHTVNSHTHSVNPPSKTTSGPSQANTFCGYRECCSCWGESAGSSSHTHTVDIPSFTSGASAPGTSSSNHLPPYYKLAYIMKL